MHTHIHTYRYMHILFTEHSYAHTHTHTHAHVRTQVGVVHWEPPIPSPLEAVPVGYEVLAAPSAQQLHGKCWFAR